MHMNITQEMRRQKNIAEPTSVNLPLTKNELERIDDVRGAIPRRHWFALAAKEYLEKQEEQEDDE